MIKGSSVRKPSWPINSLFVDRWSPRAMTGEAVSHDELMVLLEAARWAPSSMNYQPWRMLYALRGTAHWPTFLDLLIDANRVWAQHAGALVVFISKAVFDDASKPCITHAYDTGAAWQNFALQASLSNLTVHGIQGFDYARARAVLNIPAEFSVDAMAVVGKPGDKSLLPEKYQQRESPNDRRPLAESVREGAFSFQERKQ
jgi:nitroreductase